MCIFFFFLIITWSGLLVGIKGSLCISKSLRILWISFSWTDSGLCIYHLVPWSNCNCLHNFQWITCYCCYHHYSNWCEPSQLGLQNTLTASLQKSKTLPISVLDTTLINLMVEAQVMLELWGMWNTLWLPSLPGPLWPRVVAPDRVLSMDQIELNYALILNWIVWNKTVLTFKLYTYAKFF